MSDLTTLDEQTSTPDELVASGALVDATAVYAEGNGSDPSGQPRVLFTPAAWADLAEWHPKNTSYQDVSGRIHDVVTACGFWHPLTGRRRNNMIGERTVFSLVRIPNTRQACVPRRARAVVTVSVDDGRPTLIFGLPDE